MEANTIPPVLIQVNTEINNLLTYTTERKDYWQTLEESKSRGKGDCDDFACAKFHKLTALGFTPHLMVCLANKFGEPYRDELPAETFELHMVCICNGYVLDNKGVGEGRNLPVPLAERTDLSKPAYLLYRHCAKLDETTTLPLAQFSKWKDWLHRSNLLGAE